MDIPKNRRKVEIPISLYDFEGSLEGIEDRLRLLMGDRECEDPQVEKSNSWDDSDWQIVGHRAATPKELERSKKASERAKEQAAKKKAEQEAIERAHYERLKKKFADA